MSIAPNLFWDPKIAGRAGAGGGLWEEAVRHRANQNANAFTHPRCRIENDEYCKEY